MFLVDVNFGQSQIFCGEIQRSLRVVFVIDVKFCLADNLRGFGDGRCLRFDKPCDCLQVRIEVVVAHSFAKHVKTFLQIKLMKNVIVKLLMKSANIDPTIGTSMYALTDGANLPVKTCMFAIALGVAPMPKPHVPADKIAAS